MCSGGRTQSEEGVPLRVLLDVQALQGQSRHRGLGRYSLEFAAAFAALPEVSDALLLVNGGGSPAELLATRRLIERRVHQAKVLVFDAPWPWAGGDDTSVERHRAAELVRAQYIRELAPDLVVVCSLFEGFNESVISVPRGSHPFTAVIGYDVLPLTDPASRPESGVPPMYMHRLESLSAADLVLAISDYSASEIAGSLGISAPPIRTIWGAPFSLSPTYQGSRAGVVCAGGDTPRKNEAATIEAFSTLPVDLRRAHPLTISGRRRDREVGRLWDHGKSCGLTEADFRIVAEEVSDEELANQYRSARLVVMPSLGEGLGLPVMEAWSVGTAAIASSTTSLGQVIANSSLTFDPEDPDDQARLLERLLSSDSALDEAVVHGQRRLDQFTWQMTARRALDAIVEVRSTAGTASVPVDPPEAVRPRLAFLTPWPPEQSGIARHAQVLAPELSKYYSVTLVNDHESGSSEAKSAGWDVISVADYLKNPSTFDRVLFNIGNNFHFHSMALHAMTLTPGVVVAHDLDLIGLVQACSPPLPESEEALRFTEGGIRGLTSGALPLGVDLYRASLGVIVHSKAALEGLTRDSLSPLPAARVAQCPLVVITQTGVPKAEARKRLGIPDDCTLVATFGRVFPEKRVGTAWAAVQDVARDHPQIMYRVVGPADPDYATQLRAEFGDSIGGLTGAVDDEKYGLWLQACDIAIQLRETSRGETSGAVIEAGAHACALIVEGIGSFSEFGAYGAVVVPHPATEASVAEALKAVIVDRGRSLRSAVQGELFREAHSRQTVALAYRDSIESFYNLGGAECFGQLDRDQAVAASRNRTDRVRPTVYWAAGDSSDGSVQADVQRYGNLLVTAGASDVWNCRTFPVCLDGEDVMLDFARVAELTERPGLASELKGIPTGVHPREGDVLVVAGPPRVRTGLEVSLTNWRARGGRTLGVVPDLLGIHYEDFFQVPGSWFAEWLRLLVRHCDVLACPSESVAGELEGWLEENVDILPSRPRIEVVHPGASPSAHGSPPIELQRRTTGRRRVLVVGPIEPIKAIEVVLQAAEVIWSRGEDVTLTVVGERGWALPDVISRLTDLSESDAPLTWIEDASEAAVRWEYLNADLLVETSRGDGLAMSVRQAAAFGVPVLARDLATYREVLGDSGRYFRLDGDLADAILNALASDRRRITASRPLVSWRDSARRLLEIVDLELVGPLLRVGDEAPVPVPQQ